MGDGKRLYICGTNAHNPKDWVVNVSKNTTQLSPIEINFIFHEIY